jgi:hypothetical protein
MTPVVSMLAAAALLASGAEPHPRDITPEAAAPEIVGPTTTPEPAPAPASTAPAPAPAAQPPAPTAVTPEPAPTSPPPGPVATNCWERRSQCRSLSITGIVAGSLGLAAIGTGVGLMVRPDEPIPDRPAFQKSTRPVGVVSLGMGIGVVVTAALMIIAGRRAHRLGLDPADRRTEAKAR